jgi:hypothetical protein
MNLKPETEASCFTAQNHKIAAGATCFSFHWQFLDSDSRKALQEYDVCCLCRIVLSGLGLLLQLKLLSTRLCRVQLALKLFDSGHRVT